MRILSLLMAGALLTGALTGCGSKKDDSAQSGDSSGVITHSTIRQPSAARIRPLPVCDELIKEFNEKYAGKYEIKKEDVPGDQNYIDKIKVQLGTGDLPPVIYGGGYNLLDMVVAKDLAVDLTDGKFRCRLEGTVFGYRAGYQQPRRQDLRFLDGRPGYRLLLQQGPV